MRRVLPIALGALVLTACGETPMGPVAPNGPPPQAYAPPAGAVFHERDFAWSTAPGTGSISGVLAFRAPGAYTCSGEDVILTPETPWSRRRMEILYGSAYRAAAPAELVRSRMANAPRADYARFARRTKCDGADRFSFEGLPDGSWFVITLAKPTSGAGGSVAIMRRVETRSGRKFVSLG